MDGQVAGQWKPWLRVYGLGLAALVLATLSGRAVLLRPRFGLPALTAPGGQVVAEIRTPWPWTFLRWGSMTAPLQLVDGRGRGVSWHGNHATLTFGAPAGQEGTELVFRDRLSPRPRLWSGGVAERAAQPLRLVHIADLPTLGEEAKMAQFVREMQLLRPDLILATGDISYVETQAWYDFLIRSLQQTEVPVVAVAGNHERKDWPLWLRNFGPLNNHRVDYGPLTILSLDSVHGRDALTPSQLVWFREQLEAVKDRTIIVQLHHPIFPAGTDGKGEGHGSGGNLKGFQRAFVDLCVRYRVSAVLSGHWHQDAVFDQGGRLRDDTPDFPGPRFITTTTLGSEARLVTRWPHRHQGYRVLDFVDGHLAAYTSDPENLGRAVPMWSQTLGRIQVEERAAGATVHNGTAWTLQGRLRTRGGFDFPVNIPPGATRSYPQEVK
jgi:3',5'-cyclic AMP phosphodiesterase CpdA